MLCLSLLLMILTACAPGSSSLPGSPSTSAPPDSLQEAVQEGNEAYQAGRYPDAIAAYRTVLQTGRASVALYYNLGNAYYRAGELGRAIQFYEKARRLRPGDARIQHNLQQARDEVNDGAGRRPGPAGQSLAAFVRAHIAPLPVYVTALLLLAAAGAVAVVRDAPAADAPGWRHPLALTLAGAGLMAGVAAMAGSYLDAQASHAVVLTDRVPLRTSPSGTAPADTSLSEGILVQVLPPPSPAPDRWTYVHLPDGSSGWIPSPALGPVE